ncbi:LacI family DNA-binding transcriptional regulator [Dactylosporangium sp. AC04546]|uniref:LacI family DNA-binding transcriptional regulator n=1 Tax=Dactylosporangium sp. AC04546 TaxID=2862460 RepID=UPI001EDCB016|nr:LacI family DNA-binding transcriptional regulator [Dactylosporangium sp. AC04546]WVK87369.1 LacI family DNA-binding transcriptional regulator [Dactylosporangium sp. AC04546]
MKALSKPTIYEVARRAGVSIATVSRALRGSQLVTAETRRRVVEAAEALSFTPSRSARSLAEGRHAANGIVFPHLVGPYYAEVLLGYEEAAAELGRSVLILGTEGRPDATAQVLDLAGRVDGLVVMGRTVPDEVVVELAASGLPIVLLAREPVDGLDTIRSENWAAARELTAHLLAHGHRRLVFLGDPDASPDVADRYRGFVAASGKRAPVRCAFDVDAGLAAARTLLRRRIPPDALFCANDEIALGAHLAAAAEGRDVPGDIAITGWDDVMAARFVGLTTVRQPMRELGATAARWLHDRMSTPEAHPVRHRVIPTRLVVRRSCGPDPCEGRQVDP